MGGQAILGETVLDQPTAAAADSPPQAAGAMATIETLVSQHSLLVFRIAYSILRNHQDAEDATQECFLRVMKVRKRLAQVILKRKAMSTITWSC
jgi:RNA polymerase sigma-70 factor, ECF subfamily